MMKHSHSSALIEFVLEEGFDDTWNYLSPLCRKILEEADQLAQRADPLEVFDVLARVAAFETLVDAFGMSPGEAEDFVALYQGIRARLIHTLSAAGRNDRVATVDSRMTWCAR